jgi:tRNA(fMet)-specific endonuclease VapC
MPDYLIDTNVLVDAVRQKRKRWDLLQSLVAGGSLLGCSVITIGELYAGMRPHERVPTERLLAEFYHYEITSPLAQHAGILKNEWSAKGRTLTLADMLIAATAIQHELILVTSNTKDFPMREIRLHRPE